MYPTDVEEDTIREIPEALKGLCVSFLDKYEEVEKLKAELETIKTNLKEEFNKNPEIKTVNFPELKLQVQGRDANTIKYDEVGIFNLIGSTIYGPTVFPRKFDKNLLSDEDVINAGLAEKCTVRNLDTVVLEDLIGKKVLDLDQFKQMGLIEIISNRVIARAKIRK